MSRPVISTHAGDDSDGKLWGIGGINILFIVTGLLLSVGLSLMFFRQQVHSPGFSFGAGSLPLVLASAYIFTLRQGRPRSYDPDPHHGQGILRTGADPRNRVEKGRLVRRGGIACLLQES